MSPSSSITICVEQLFLKKFLLQRDYFFYITVNINVDTALKIMTNAFFFFKSLLLQYIFMEY